MDRSKRRAVARLAVLLPAWAAAVGAAGPEPGDGAATRHGVSASGLEAIQSAMDHAVAEGRIPAAIGLVARGPDIVWLGTAGEMAPGIPMRDDAILPLASVGKMFTAVAVMILVEEGTISLEDPVARYIREFGDVSVEVATDDGGVRRTPPDRPITIFDLLTHTGGLTVRGDAFWAAWDAHSGRTTTTHLARDLAAMPLYAQPGESFDYGPTGASYEVLGAVIEIASGRTLAAFMAERIFAPLGLSDSSFYVTREQAHRLPAVYRRVDGVLQLDRAAGEDFPPSTFFHGGGGVRSSPTDLVRFARLFLEGGAVDGVRILQPATIELMMRDHAGDRVPETWRSMKRGWGFGAAVYFDRTDNGAETSPRYGWVGGGFAKLWVDPDERLIVYFNTPLTPPGDFDFLDELDRLVLAALVD